MWIDSCVSFCIFLPSGDYILQWAFIAHPEKIYIVFLSVQRGKGVDSKTLISWYLNDYIHDENVKLWQGISKCLFSQGADRDVQNWGKGWDALLAQTAAFLPLCQGVEGLVAPWGQASTCVRSPSRRQGQRQDLKMCHSVPTWGLSRPYLGAQAWAEIGLMRPWASGVGGQGHWAVLVPSAPWRSVIWVACLLKMSSEPSCGPWQQHLSFT